MGIELPAGLPAPGPHPYSREPFVRYELDIRSNDEVVHTFPPQAPSRRVERWDDDACGWVLERTLTEDEYTNAMTRYRTDRAEWAKTAGAHVVRGVSTVKATFRCANGDWAEGVYLERDGSWWWARCGYGVSRNG